MGRKTEVANMIDYDNLRREMELRKKQLQEEKFFNQFTCNYCPSTGHSLCTHKDKCLMNEEILNIVCEISRVNQRIKWIKSGHVDKEMEIVLHRLNERKRELYREYYSIETDVGG